MGKTGQGCCGVVADPAPMDSGYDCVMIPAPSSAVAPMAMIKAVNICGRGKPIEIFCISAYMQKISIGCTVPNSRQRRVRGFGYFLKHIPLDT